MADLNDDLHLALCIVKLFALLIIASSLWSISSALSGGYGYATDKVMGSNGFSDSTTPGPLGNKVGVHGGPHDLLMASYNTVGSSIGPFAARYEPPVFWNIGDINTYEADQQSAAAQGQINIDDSANSITFATPPAVPPAGAFTNYKPRGHMTKQKGSFSPY